MIFDDWLLNLKPILVFCITKIYFLRYFYIIGLHIFNVGNMIFRRQTKRFVHTFLAGVSYLVFDWPSPAALRLYGRPYSLTPRRRAVQGR